MPAPIVLQDQSGLAQGIAGAGSALSQALQQRGMERKQAQGLSAFQTAMGQADPNDPNAIASAYQQALAQGADPAQLQFLGQQYQQAKERSAFSSAYDDALNFGGLSTPQGQEAFVNKFVASGGDPFKAFQLFKKDSKGENTFDKKLNEFKADAVVNYIQGGAEDQNTLKENLDFLENNLENVGRMKGIFRGEIFQEGEAFTEFRNRGNLVLDGVIKVFNKAGVLPQKKLEWIRETFGISPFDTQAQIRGKINSLRSLQKEAGVFNQNLGKLIDRYGPNIPNEEFIKLQQNANKFVDQFTQGADSPQKETVHKSLPRTAKKGSTAYDPDTGKKFIFNGTRWIKQG